MKPWYVITGGPSSGKSTLISALRSRNFHTVDEAARVLIDQEISRGLSIAEIRADEHRFQQRVLQLKLDTEARLPSSEVIFFDRGIPDTTAYYRAQGFPETPELLQALAQSRYRRVFILDPLEYEPDYARVESAQAARQLDALLERSYTELGMDVRRIPVLPVKARLELVLSLVDAARL